VLRGSATFARCAPAGFLREGLRLMAKSIAPITVDGNRTIGYIAISDDESTVIHGLTRGFAGPSLLAMILFEKYGRCFMLKNSKFRKRPVSQGS